MQLRKDYTGGDLIETIYFGGGTPSLLEADELNPILERLHTLFPVAPDAEIKDTTRLWRSSIDRT